MSYGTLADLLVAFHATYVAFVVFGLVIIWIGWFRGWQWVRNPWFRVLHLIAIVIVGVEAIFAIECPITVWERQLREAAGQPVSDATFVGRFFHNVLFWENVPPWVFTVLHVGCAVLVIVTFVLAPPRFPRKRVATDPASKVTHH